MDFDFTNSTSVFIDVLGLGLFGIIMDITKHCQLCDHQIIDFKAGTFCGKTNRKPAFVNVCASAQLDSKLESRIESINMDYQIILNRQKPVYKNFIIFLVIGVASIITGIYLIPYVVKVDDYSFPIYKMLTYSSIYALFGGFLYLIPLATRPLLKYINDYRLAKSKKDQLDMILKKYNIGYDINIEFIKSPHNYDDIDVELKIHK